MCKCPLPQLIKLDRAADQLPALFCGQMSLLFHVVYALRKRLILENVGQYAVWIGVATVTTANGLMLPIGASITLRTTALVQAITASGTGNIAYLEEYDS